MVAKRPSVFDAASVEAGLKGILDNPAASATLLTIPFIVTAASFNPAINASPSGIL